MKKTLLIISDITGFDNLSWINNYIELLKSNFQIVLYDSRKLAGIERSDLNEKELHSKFINNGIEKAANLLVKFENEEVDILAFSVGGTIAWKAAINGLKVKNLYAISATRLRFERNKPNCKIHLIYAENDLFKPEDQWFKLLELNREIIKNGEHEIYKEMHVINKVSKFINNSQV